MPVEMSKAAYQGGFFVGERKGQSCAWLAAAVAQWFKA
jgi:hypothetical protein